ncbi:TauD/TfdA family dioxygenase [bacterium]|nr:TauD/TfdA family dioxygenase [bacterium]
MMIAKQQTQPVSGKWSSQIPRDSDAVVAIPERIVDSCLEFVSCEPETFKHGEAVLSWSRIIKRRLLQGPGFVCLRTQDGGYSTNDFRTVYAGISRSLGQLNTRYGEFFDVMDRGLDHTKQTVPVSKTRASTGFHTDSSAANYCPAVVGLLCLQPAQSGGESLLGNAANLYSWLAKNYPRSLAALTRPIHRDVITPGTEHDSDAIRNNAFPIFSRTENSVQFRYMRYWIETAYKKLNEPLPGGLTRAMNLIDSYLFDTTNTYSRMLNRGEILFVNNHHLCHSRTAFVDSPEQDQKRILVRTWIDNINHTPPQGRLIESSSGKITNRKASAQIVFDPALAS